MKNIAQYLDDLKEKTGSDYASAKALEIRKESLSNMRKRGQIADDTAIKIADELGINRDEVLIAAAIARSEGTTKEAWIAHAKRFGIAASLTALVFSGLETNAYSITAKVSDNIHYAKYLRVIVKS